MSGNLKTIFISAIVAFGISGLMLAVFSQSNLIGAGLGANSFGINNASFISASDPDTISRADANQRLYEERHNVITKTVASVSPAVVGINVIEIREYRDAWSQDPFWRYWFGDRTHKQQVKGLGSGAIISPDGYILTNDHVAGNASEVLVTMTNGKQYKAEVIGSDQASDICLLKIDETNLPYVRFGNSDDILIGEWAIAFGNPFGLFDINEKPTVTVGVVSATGMNLGASQNRYYVNMIQTDAAINSGNSGGPLVNSIGELIGLNTLIYTAQGSTGSVGVGFAIPINKVKRVIDEIKSDGKVDREFWTGLSIQSVDEGIAKYYGLTSQRGAIVTLVQKGSPAATAGIEVYDIIIGINGYKINDENTLIGVLQEFRTDDEIEVHIVRDKKDMTLRMKLSKR